MKLRPLGNNVLLKRKPAEEKTKGGIIVPHSAQKHSSEGKVVAVGPGTHDEHGVLRAPRVKAGDQVLFEKFAGHEISIQDEEFVVIEESTLLGVLEK